MSEPPPVLPPEPELPLPVSEPEPLPEPGSVVSEPEPGSEPGSVVSEPPGLTVESSGMTPFHFTSVILSGIRSYIRLPLTILNDGRKLGTRLWMSLAVASFSVFAVPEVMKRRER